MHAPAAASRDGRRFFGVFEFDARTLELRKNGRPVAVRPQALKVLALLLATPGAIVSRGDIERALWNGDTFVDFEQGVNHAIRELRAALGDAAESPVFIQTLPRRGYRFLAPVTEAAAVDTAPVAVATPVDVRASVWPRRWIGLALATATLGVVALVAVLARRDGGSAVPITRGVLAVRPFATTGGDAFAGSGLANAISARLGGQQALPVLRISGDAASATPSGVTHVLSGEIGQRDARVSVVARLDDVRAGTTMWSDRIEVQADELFSVENVIAERVVDALHLRLAAAEYERLRRRYTRDSVAYEEYLRGRSALVTYTPDGTRSAVQSFERALARDAGYTLARAGLAMACADMYLRFAPSGEVDAWGERADREARAALDADWDLPEAHVARAAVARKREFDWNAAIEASRRALILNPNLDQPYLFMAAAYYHLGYMDEALLELDKGRRVHGTDVVEPVRIEALVALFSGKFAPARARLEDVSRLSSQPIGDTYLALAYYYSGSGDRARAMLASLADHPSASTSSRAGAALAGVLAAAGESDAARAQLQRVTGRTYRDHHVAYWLGAAHAQLGDDGEAIRWLHIAADTGFPCVLWFERDPLLEPLRKRAGYGDLLAYVRARRDASVSRVQR